MNMSPVTPERKSQPRTVTSAAYDRRQRFEHEFPTSVEMSHIVQAHMSPGLIQDEVLNQVIRERVLDMFRLPRDMVYFCGALPVSLMRKDLDMLRTMEYLVAEKSDGLRHLLLLFRHNDQSYAVFIDRGNRAFRSAYKFSSHLRDGLGTLLDGELVWERTGMRYYVHDIVCVCGKTDVAFEKYADRMYHVRELLRWHIFPADDERLNNITFIPKQVFPLRDLAHVVDHVIPNLHHHSDGLIFTCNTLPHQGKKNTLLFKYKLPKDHTLDLQLGECVGGHNTYELLTWDTRVTHVFETISLSREKWASVGVQSPSAQKGCILECAYDFEAAKWVPVNIRLDKIKPNDISTIQLTLQTMMETLSMEELRSIAKDAKHIDTRIMGNPDDYGYKP